MLGSRVLKLETAYSSMPFLSAMLFKEHETRGAIMLALSTEMEEISSLHDCFGGMLGYYLYMYNLGETKKTKGRNQDKSMAKVVGMTGKTKKFLRVSKSAAYHKNHLSRSNSNTDYPFPFGSLCMLDYYV